MIPVLNLVVVIMCIYSVTMCVCDQLRKGAIGGYSRDGSVVTRPKKKVRFSNHHLTSHRK